MPGYTDPQSIHNPTTGVAIPASWGDIIRDNDEWFAGGSSNPKPSCRLFNNAAISVANASFVALTFNSERWDNGAMHSTVSNTSRITIPTGGGGKYLIGGCIQYAANATGTRGYFIRLNGSTYIAQTFDVSASGSASSRRTVETLYQLAAGDYVELVAYQDSGGALNAEVSANYAPEFWAMWMAL